jgi:hypothetical protein
MRAHIVNAGSQSQFAVVEDDAGASAKVEGYRMLETGDIGLLVRESRRRDISREAKARTNSLSSTWGGAVFILCIRVLRPAARARKIL